MCQNAKAQSCTRAELEQPACACLLPPAGLNVMLSWSSCAHFKL